MLTIIIPTKNRSDFLIRLLYYYADTGYKHWIYIGDSSNSYHAERTKSVINKLEGRLKIVYFGYPDLNSVAACRNKLLEMVTTPYAVYIGDDDFLVPTSLERCIEFLENNKEYVGANGLAILFSLKTVGSEGEFSYVEKYKQKSVESDTAVKRLLEYVSDYFVNQFSVQRTNVLKKVYKDVLSLSDRSFAEEALPCYLSVIEGKIGHLNCFYLIRQAHDRQYHLPDLYDRIIHPNWSSSYQVFHNSLVEALIENDGIEKEKAYEVVKQAFWLLISDGLKKGFKQYHATAQPITRERIKMLIKRIPGVVYALGRIKASVFSSRNISLPVLLSSRSSYHADFMPIYNIVRRIKNYDHK